MNRHSSPCLWGAVAQSSPAPCDRYKHTCCAHSNHVYLLGGREKSILSDFWRYNVVSNEWTELDCGSDDAPDELEEHTMVLHQGVLYVFGGMIDSAYTDEKTPLWLYDIDKEQWMHLQGKDSKSAVPVNRKGHSAVVFGDAMHVYGGYIDMKGSSQEFWTFNFDTREWALLASTLGDGGPGPRHSHSAMVYQDGMYLYGGLMGLREQSDFWKWSFCGQSWSSIKSLTGPSKLVGHSAIVYKDGMLLFGGGETQNFPKNILWRYSFTAETWEKLTTLTDSSPPSRIYHCSTGLGVSFQAQASRAPFPGQSPSARAKHNSLKLRPFKNRCFPSKSYSDWIELDTFHTESNKTETPGYNNICHTEDSQFYQHPLQTSCLTFTNREALTDDSSCDCLSKPEDSMVAHLPDLLLVLGGRPLTGQSSISVWQLTMAEL
ncbi:ras guanine nucleotide exchange factor F [Amia ocellicauda]|uniref:ras guanine nucleotide exchange factor F n=1 Tax=Amia ocellicauda TaxID=2972642 RepID=UPI003463860C